MTTPDGTPKIEYKEESLDLSYLDAMGSDGSIGSPNHNPINLETMLTSSPLPTPDPVASTKSSTPAATTTPSEAPLPATGAAAAPAAAAATPSTQPAAAVAPAASPIAPPAATTVKKAAAKKAAVASPASGAVPVAIPVITTGFEDFPAINFIEDLKLENCRSIQDIRIAAIAAFVKIDEIVFGINTIFEDNAINPMPSESFSTRASAAEINGKLENIKTKMASIQHASLLGGALNKLDNVTKSNLLKTSRNVMILVSSLIVKIDEAVDRITPAPAVAPTVVGGGGARTPGAPAVDPTALERQMNSEWDALKNHIKDPQQEYTTKKQKLEEYIGKLIAGTYGAVTGVPDDNPAKLKLVEARALFQSCVSVEQEFRTVNILSSQNAIQDSIARLIRLATDAQTIDALENIRRSANDLKRDFSTTVGQTRRIKIEYTEPNARNVQVKKTKLVDLAKDPLVFDMMYGNTTYIINRDLTEDFFDAQTKRISGLDKSKTAFDKLEADIKVLTTATIAAIESTKTEIMAAIPRTGGIISKGDWNRFLGVYADKVEVLRNVIKNKNAELDAKVPSPDVDNKVRDIVNVEKAKIAIEAAKFKQDFDVLPYPKSKSPRGNNANQAFNSYLWVDGVTKDKTVGPNKDKPTGKVTDMTIFSGVSFITTPNFDDLSPTAPTPLGSWSPFETTGAVNARINGIPTKFGSMSPMKRRLIVGGSVALGVAAAALISFVLNNKKEGAGKDPDAKPKTAVTASANMADTQEAIAQRVEQAATRIERVAKGVVSDRSAAVARMSSAQVLESIQLKTGESVTFTGDDILNPGNYNQIKRAGSSSNPSHEERLKYYTLAHLISDMSSAPADNDYSVSRIRLLRFVLSEDTNFKPENITAVSSKAALTHWALDTSREAEKFVIYFSDNNITIYLRGDADWRKAIEDTVRGHMVSGGSGELTDPEMYELFNNTTIQNRWDVLEQAQSNGTLADIMKNKKEYFVKNK